MFSVCLVILVSDFGHCNGQAGKNLHHRSDSRWGHRLARNQLNVKRDVGPSLPAADISRRSLFLGRQRRVGTNPHCRRCNYLLHGINSERCPECGAMLSPAAIAYGEQHRRRAPLVLGFTLLALWIVFAWGGLNRLRSIDWYHHKPTYFVLKDLSSNQVAVAMRAWTGLTRRETEGSLPTASHEKLESFALDEQGRAASPFSLLDMATINYLGNRLSAGDLTDEQRTKLFEQSIRMHLRIRSKVIAGDAIPYLAEHDGLAPSNMDDWTKLAMDGAEIDGKHVDGNMGGYAAWGGSGTGTFGSSLIYRTPGKHRIALTFKIETCRGPMDSVANSKLLYQSTRTLSGQFEVLANKPDGLIQAISDPKLTGAMKAAIVPESFHFNPHGGNLSGPIHLLAPPANVALDVYVKYGGAEHQLGTVTCLAGANIYDSISGNLPGPVPAMVELILRPSERAARMTADEYSFWNQELTFPNIPVAQP